MITYALIISIGMISISLLLNLYRLVVGPTVADRVLALDTSYIIAIALLILFSIYMETTLYFEAALLIALMGFVSTVALSKYLLRGDIIE